MNRGNIEHPTSNIQHPMPGESGGEPPQSKRSRGNGRGFRFMVPMPARSARRLSMNRPNRREVWSARTCPRFDSRRHVASLKAATCRRTPRRCRANQFMVPRRVQFWRWRLPMNLRFAGTPPPSPPVGERVASGRVRGFRGSIREAFGEISPCTREHRTSNIQHRTSNGLLLAVSGCWMFDVGCSMFFPVQAFKSQSEAG
jgi:hypothetical protein